MALRVAFDLDGTLADMHVVLRREAEKLFGVNQLSSAVEQSGSAFAKPMAEKSGLATDTAGNSSIAAPGDDVGAENGTTQESKSVMSELHLSSRQQMQLWDHVKTIDNFWSGLPEMEPGIVARIAHAASQRRWEVIFLTTRPLVAGETVQLQSQRWLETHGFTLPSVFVVQRSRGRIAEALELDAVVDDRPENCLDVAVDSKAKPILIWPGDQSGLPPGAKRLGVRIVSSISEALDLLIKLDDLKNEPGVVRSIKKFFGKETTV